MVDNSKATILSRFLKPVLFTIAEKKIPYCICGNYNHLPYYTDNDVDIWTKKPKRVLQIIKYICIQQQLKIYLINSNATGTNIFIWTQAENESMMIHLDILAECRWYGIFPLVKSEVIECNRKTYNTLYVANETIDAAMHLMYPLSHFGVVIKKYYRDIKSASIDDSFWNIIKNGWGNSFSNKIKPLVETGDWSGLEQVFAQNRKKLIWNSIRNARWPEFKSLFSFIFSNLQRLYKPAGLFIAFVGPDGCGKTTVQNSLEPFFKKGFTKGKINRFYWRPFLLPRIKAIFSRGKNTQFNDVDEPAARLELRKVNLCKRLLHCVKLIYYWVDYIIGRVKYQGAWSRGGVVCFDRYWDDLLVFPERFGLNVPKCLVWALGIFVPKPDIVFYLHAEPEVLNGRKLELPLDEMKAQVDHYKNLSRLNNNYVVIDGDQSRDDVLSAVIQTCLKKMSKRYRQRS